MQSSLTAVHCLQLKWTVQNVISRLNPSSTSLRQANTAEKALCMLMPSKDHCIVLMQLLLERDSNPVNDGMWLKAVPGLHLDEEVVGSFLSLRGPGLDV